MRRFTLEDPLFAGRTGRGVRVAIVDSGVAAGHPHVGELAVAVAVGEGALAADVADRIGHGTAVAAAIREKAPDAELISVKIFHRSLVTDAAALAEGITRSVALGARLINLSLGTANPAHEDRLRRAVSDACRAGALVVSASESQGVRWLPGALDEVVGVLADWEDDRAAVTISARASDGDVRGVILRASAFPRPIAGVPKERNLSGVSFAVANATGFLARLLEGSADTDLLALLGRSRDG